MTKLTRFVVGAAVAWAIALPASLRAQEPPPAEAPPPMPPPFDAPPAPAPAPEAAPAPVTAPVAPPAPAPPAKGPVIELPPEATRPPPTAADKDAAERAERNFLLRGMMDYRLQSGNTVVGGYGQFSANYLKIGPNGDYDGTATVRRLVVFVGHNFTANLRAYVELEWENAIASNGSGGSAEVEQAFLDWRFFNALGLRVGLMLIPMGIINQWHEPSVFHGVERPAVDTLIIPTTWRELGGGFFGQLPHNLRYELYLTTALSPVNVATNTLNYGTAGLISARSNGSLSSGNAWAISARLEVEPLLGVIAGVSFYGSQSAGHQKFYDSLMQPLHLSLPIIGYAVDARMRRWGFEARAVWAEFFLPQSGELMNAYQANGLPYIPAGMVGAIPTRIHGGYVELAWNVLRPFPRITHQLLPFGRLEYYDTQASVPAGTMADPARNVKEITVGLTYRPIVQVVFKLDAQWRNRELGLDERQVNFGVGYMF